MLFSWLFSFQLPYFPHVLNNYTCVQVPSVCFILGGSYSRSNNYKNMGEDQMSFFCPNFLPFCRISSFPYPFHTDRFHHNSTSTLKCPFLRERLSYLSSGVTSSRKNLGLLPPSGVSFGSTNKMVTSKIDVYVYRGCFPSKSPIKIDFREIYRWSFVQFLDIKPNFIL